MVVVRGGVGLVVVAAGAGGATAAAVQRTMAVVRINSIN